MWLNRGPVILCHGSATITVEVPYLLGWVVCLIELVLGPGLGEAGVA